MCSIQFLYSNLITISKNYILCFTIKPEDYIIMKNNIIETIVNYILAGIKSHFKYIMI